MINFAAVYKDLQVCGGPKKNATDRFSHSTIRAARQVEKQFPFMIPEAGIFPVYE